MQRLILLRHGEAEAHAASGRDIDRALTADGVRSAARAAKALAEAGATPDIALVSTAKRTRETWTEAKARFPLSKDVFKPEIYNASAGGLLTLAADCPEQCVMIVGHNPSLQGLALDLLARQGAPASLVARVESRFPPATAIVFRFRDDQPELETLLIGGLA